MKSIGLWLFMVLCVTGCTLASGGITPISGATPYPTTDPVTDADLWTVTLVIDGDTIEVERNGQVHRVRYIGVNTPESDEPCYRDARTANSNMVRGQKVRLERDVSDTDRYDRLLRFVYVGDVFVNERLVREGWAEAVLYRPDEYYFETFRQLEQEAARQNLGCHATGIFNDGNDER